MVTPSTASGIDGRPVPGAATTDGCPVPGGAWVKSAHDASVAGDKGTATNGPRALATKGPRAPVNVVNSSSFSGPWAQS